MDYDIVMGKFKEYFLPKRNLIHKRACFNDLRQREGESAEEFVRALYEMAGKCDYSAIMDELIRDRLVVGIGDKNLSQKMQMKGTLTLETAKMMVSQAEVVQKQMSEQKGWAGGATSMGCTEEVAKKKQEAGAREPRERGQEGNM